MPLQPGHKLAHYEILEPIGKGGMGEVFRARDGKLGRDVAIKVLPDEFAQDTERLRRFQREAKVLASLNHPNIAAIYGLEQSESTHYLVLELVPGETLAERISRGPIPLEEALGIAVKITAALQEAHAQGIVHRDLKPANVMLTPDEKVEVEVKVLDFGLAKAFLEETPQADGSMSPTLTREATRVGVILGTAAYMSPEQARGKGVDKRADVWAFGAVLYEMLTGRKAFGGKDVSDILAAVLKTEPDWKLLPAALDPIIVKLLQRSLEKDRVKRRRDMGDIGLELEEFLAAPGFETEGVARAPSVTPGGWPAAWVMVAILAVSLVAAFAAWHLKPSEPRPLVRLEVALPASVHLSPTSTRLVAFSPDGSKFVYAANERLYLRRIDELESTPLPGTEGLARNAFFSPDGQWIGFYKDTSLRKVSVSGGAPVMLCDAVGFPRGVSWEPDGTILFGAGFQGILKVSEDGGTPEVLVPPEKGVRFHGPQVLPGGETLLFTVTSTNWDDGQIVAQSLTTGKRRTLVERGRDGRFVPSGHILYGLANTVFAVPFDPDRLEVTGGAAPVLEGVMAGSKSLSAEDGYATATVQFSVSNTGSLVYVPEGAGATSRLVWVDREGRVTPLSAQEGGYSTPRLSPDDERVVFVRGGDLWIHEIELDTQSRLTTHGSRATQEWSPDGEWIAFASDRDGEQDLYRRRADFTGEAERLLEKEYRQWAWSWSPDGTRIAFTDSHRPEGGPNINILSLEDGTVRPFVASDAYEAGPSFSPDGKWIAYHSNESGRFEIYLQPFPGPGRRWPVSTNGGRQPAWSHSGEELFYTRGDQLVAVAIETEPQLRIGIARTLFENRVLGLPGTGAGGSRHYDVARDGKRFVMVTTPEGPRQTMNIVLNWFDELKRLVPTDN